MIGVLVVDDDFMVSRIHRGFVEQVPGFRVVGTAHTGQEAIDAAARLSPELILLDLYLPDMFGLDVVVRLRAAGHDCDVMVITAAKEADAVRGAVRHGVVNYLLKPFGVDDLRQRLEQYARRRSGLGEVRVRDQADVDRALARASAPTAGLPKGLSPETARLVEQALRSAAETLSAAECADRIGISRVSARRYLEHLRDSGRAEVRLRYAVPGRPEHRYRWVSA
ncbi:transcriptional regulatory protein [Actinoplanes philippinensis]|uniref:Transcriptional regulatory protein n=1 Tax=Actinoplanes philippinensis TaxID=35752 RepID=A0A1I2HNY9_9ACTN|nr:response regulator [Actinoplanes philippinensis]GIE74216.1 transcriptional regulatory protein [Actinoplanes philippinensis]SFF31864.1 Response regulator of citrate/malate metabolism [Actinoplanes philippinensis]